jgi:AcrR family transcriptional regulator
MVLLMVAVTARHGDDENLMERRTRILDAAERCFVRAGFHRTTMQDVAAEAAMSPGNLYRYFPSKDAMAAGLAERDRAAVAEDFARLVTAEDFADSFARLGRKHLEEEPREKAILCLEIWAEATRNAAFAEMTQAFDCELGGRMTSLFTEAQKRGAIAGEVDPGALALLVMTLANGLFVRRAVARDFDPHREITQFMAVIEAAFAGRIDLKPARGQSDEA